jgi:hypothetical protein
LANTPPVSPIGDTGGAGAVGGRRGGRADHRGVEARGQVRDTGSGAQALDQTGDHRRRVQHALGDGNPA